MSDAPRNWKLRLRYGLLTTPFTHDSLLADGVVGELGELRHAYACPLGRAWMRISVWASSADEAFEMVRVIGREIGFIVDGRVMIHGTSPEEPPRDEPHGYAIAFTPYGQDS